MKAAGALVVCLALAAPAAAQQPAVVNGTLDARAISGSLESEFASILARITGPAWIGYAVPLAARDRQGGGCWAENERWNVQRTGPLKLEGPDSIYMLFRIEERRVARIRFSSADCPLDVGGLTLHWLTGVRADQSVGLVATYAASESSRRLGSSAIAALAMHDGMAATERLIALARANDSARVRGDALFWLAQRAGDKAVGAIDEAIARDPDTEVKKKAVFALSQLPKDEGVPRLIELAQKNSNPAVRRQAMFWLGQSRDPRALRFFEEVLRK